MDSAIISLAQDHFDREARYWQQQARDAYEKAAYYTELTGALKRAYRNTVAREAQS